MILNRTGERLPRALLLRALRAAGPEGVVLAVLPEAEMARLNWRHLRHRGPTDVLAFPPADVAVCPAVARREARARGLDWRQELARYAIHGCLHLKGYRDKAPKDRARMWKRQEAILASLRKAR